MPRTSEFTYSSVVPAPPAEVFAWHERPGAFARLMPPWQPVTLDREAASVRDGVAVLRMPLGLRWVSKHQASDYERDALFSDRLVSRPLGIPFEWEHRHEFAAEGDGTRITDRLTTQAPRRMLESMFAYRHRQLAADLVTHRWAQTIHPQRLTVAISGSSGTIGSELSAFLTTGGHRVIHLVRREPAGPDERRWDPDHPAPDLLEGVDAVVHLAGVSIAGRFTDAHRAAIRDSRIEPTRMLGEVAAQCGVKTFVCASAIGYYGPDRGDELLTEDSVPGAGFLAEVVTYWEAASRAAAANGGRVVQIRTGIVQTPRGGALKLQRPLFFAGLGGRMGDGEQWMSWIGIDDLVDIYYRALVDVTLDGPVNAVSPNPVRNEEFAEALGHAMHRPTVIPSPAWGPALLLGKDGAHEVALASQRVIPTKLADVGHEFRYPELEPALRHMFGTTESGWH